MLIQKTACVIERNNFPLAAERDRAFAEKPCANSASMLLSWAQAKSAPGNSKAAHRGAYNGL
jgi:hypothetical protein